MKALIQCRGKLKKKKSRKPNSRLKCSTFIYLSVRMDQKTVVY